jgi:galactokinase
VSRRVVARAPGRVNLIGEHTDYAGGFALPMAIDLAIEITYERDPAARTIELTSSAEAERALVDLDTLAQVEAVQPSWARLAAAVAAQLPAPSGGRGEVSTTIPLGAGLSSSAAFEVSLALALGFEGALIDLAHACRRAELVATKVPSGIMDQLSSVAGVEQCALLLDCRDETVQPVPIPAGLEIFVAHSGQQRILAGSEYATRRAEVERAAAVIGPLRDAQLADIERISDDTIRRRARHVISENARVLRAVEALDGGDFVEFGALLDQGHASLAFDFEISTPVVDSLVAALRAQAGVFGVRLTGGGFGGCVVAAAEPGTFDRCSTAAVFPAGAWLVRASSGAWLETLP